MLVLKRFVVGDQDLLIKLYGYSGIMNLYVKDGALPNNEFLGVFEPFNLLTLVYRQSGQVVIPLDVLGVIRLSYYATDYHQYQWMCQIALFVLKFIRYFDEGVFRLVVQYLKLRPKNLKAFHLRFYRDMLSVLGIYKEDMLTQRERKILRAITDADMKGLERLKVSTNDYLSIKEKIESHIMQNL